MKDKTGSKLHDKLTDFYKCYYSANLMVRVLSSNQSLPQLAKIAAKTFGRVADHNAIIAPITVLYCPSHRSNRASFVQTTKSLIPYQQQ
ncbi:insulinase family protein [Serratia symbiotica]|nr:insulinase family protein [Serratia symbiotica]